nr:reverse transcriptase domain-containing protein [Tanacetum cinerariifolium]
MVEAGHAAYTDRFHKLDRLLPHLLTPEGKRIQRYVYGLTLQIRGMVAATEPKIVQKAMQIDGTLTDEALRNESIKKNPKKRENGWEPSKDRNLRDDNKMTRTRNAFATTINPVRRENTVVPRNVNPINARNPTVRACYERGSTDHVKSAFPRAFMLRAEEARHDLNIMAVRIPLLDGKVLRVSGEKPEEKIRQLMNAKAKERKQEEIIVVKDFPKANASTFNRSIEFDNPVWGMDQFANTLSNGQFVLRDI